MGELGFGGVLLETKFVGNWRAGGRAQAVGCGQLGPAALLPVLAGEGGHLPPAVGTAGRHTASVSLPLGTDGMHGAVGMMGV